MQDKPQLVLIHGATATSNTFNYLVSQTGLTDNIAANYNSYKPFHYNLSMIKELIDPARPCFIVAHSLGGIYAIHLTTTHNVTGAVTVATPYGGSESAAMLAWVLPKVQLFKDVNPFSRPVYEARKQYISVPWVQVVTTRGHNFWSWESNDGVVTYKSMTARQDVQHIYLEYNHHEIMQAPELVDIVAHQYNKF
jgi:pimeloyl-ACP methyl ester carboxylesterase